MRMDGMGDEQSVRADELGGTFRKPNVREAESIQALVNYYAKKDEMLPRALNDVYELIRDC